MLRSMYSGISGMKNFQTKLDVIGNNIANVSTPGFKKGRVTFQEMMSQTTSAAQGSTETRGGKNASQVGLGSQQGTIDNIHTPGFRQTTNNPLDLSIQGDGYFVVESNDEVFYTRAGNFYLDDEGYIVNADGYYLLDTTTDVVNGNLEESRIHISEDQSFNILPNGTVEIIASGEDGEEQDPQVIAIATFSNPSGLEKEGGNLYRATGSSGEAVIVAPQSADSSAQIISNSLEMSNVDLAEEFTEMISAQRGFQANTRIITTSDEILQELVNLKR
ncbi:flagellar basal body rod protein FlgG [Oceanobacillus alkalisoli]|uniref:flagellar basal body rod protein FlgG n=1 Tax=Oceanobacillus alkalisoli TaxID=2925113 RepID=UPI001EF13735|nr:flagellar basal body rod protein FlgG [Oceanobacillus alkalisoli]MCF3942427.1 flagellar basal body rod protein FlgG [Oceanobacillus alkalisoli]MCG5103484.1 flagellar basal body rod protein FlgG [Oceanobacillus alkalisoli]